MAGASLSLFLSCSSNGSGSSRVTRNATICRLYRERSAQASGISRELKSATPAGRGPHGRQKESSCDYNTSLQSGHQFSVTSRSLFGGRTYFFGREQQQIDGLFRWGFSFFPIVICRHTGTIMSWAFNNYGIQEGKL